MQNMPQLNVYTSLAKASQSFVHSVTNQLALNCYQLGYDHGSCLNP